jgi:hypothetical protein
MKIAPYKQIHRGNKRKKNSSKTLQEGKKEIVLKRQAQINSTILASNIIAFLVLSPHLG